jgi:radical SAM protein with 4Fe4S-binding SPASM domain
MKLYRKIKYFFRYVLINPKRFFNLLLNNLSRKFKLTKLPSYPITLMVEPTNICNLKCPLCPTGAGLIKRDKGFLKFEDFKKVLDEVGDYIIHLRLWNWGEPLLNKEVFKMISYAKRKKIFVNLSTNSNFLDEEVAKKMINSGLDEVIISMDGASEETYKTYRKGGDFKKLLKSIHFLVEEKKRLKRNFPYIKLQFIIMKHNEHEISTVKDLAQKIGVDELVFKTVGIMDYFSKEDIKKYIPLNKKYSRYNVEENNVTSKVEVKNWCDFLWSEMVINWDGSVVPCCFDMNNSFVFGNAFSSSVKGIWNNSRYVGFRKTILTNKKNIPLCKNCPGTNKDTFINI